MKFLYRYYNQPIQKKLLILLISSTLMMGIAIFATLIFIYKDISRQTLTMTSKTLSLYTAQLDESLGQISSYSSNLIFDSDVQNKLKQLASSKDSYEQLTIRTALNDKLFLSASSFSFVDHIDIVTPENICLSSAPERISHAGMRYENFHDVIQKCGKCVWKLSSGQLALFRLIRTINNNFTHDPLGILIFEIDIDELTDLASFREDYYKSSFLIRDSDGKLLYSAKDSEDPDSVSHFISEKASGTADWIYCLFIPKTQILGRIITVTKTLVFLYVLLILLCIFICTRLSQKITHPLSCLSREMDLVAGGNFQIHAKELLSVTANDELRTMCQHFIHMTEQLDSLITENYRVKLLNKETQLKALQAQIDPHFLYNALDSINWLAKLAGHKQISTIVQSLAALMRQTLDTSRKEYLLKDELALLDNYLSIQQIRYGSRLAFSSFIDERMLSLKIPKLILQPLVENSIRYALERMDKICEIFLEITIYATKEGTYCKIQITDNGPGVPPNLVPCILAGTVRSSGNGIGLKNVNDRLKLLYGIPEPLSICCAPGGGACIAIQIPVDDKEDLK